MAQKNLLSARERRLRRAAARKGLSVRSVRRGKDRGRYLLIDPEFEGTISSRNRIYRRSFSLQEAEEFIAEESHLQALPRRSDARFRTPLS